MSQRPPGGCQQFLGGGVEDPKVGSVLARRILVHRRVKLEVDLVEPARDVEFQAAVLPDLDPLLEARWEFQLQQRCGTGVQPVRSEAKRRTHRPYGLDKALGKRIRSLVTGVAYPSDNVEVLRRPTQLAEEEQASATNDHKPVRFAARLEGSAKRL